MDNAPRWSDVRVVEGARLEIWCGARPHLGFESLSLRSMKHQGLSLVLLFSLSGSPLLHLVNRRRRAVLFHQFPLFFNNPGETFTPFYNKRGFMVKPYSPTRSSEQIIVPFSMNLPKRGQKKSPILKKAKKGTPEIAFPGTCLTSFSSSDPARTTRDDCSRRRYAGHHRS